MYHLSRTIYRELAPLRTRRAPLVPSARPTRNSCCAPVSARCTGSFTTARHFARPARSLFNDVRIFFSISSQLQGLHGDRAQHQSRARLPLAPARFRSTTRNGRPRSCEAMTRKGRPCQRQPLPRSDYCPSHQHLTETARRARGRRSHCGLGRDTPFARRRDLPVPMRVPRPARGDRKTPLPLGGPSMGPPSFWHSGVVMYLPAVAARSSRLDIARSRRRRHLHRCRPDRGRPRSSRPRSRPPPSDQSEGVIAAVDARARDAPASRHPPWTGSRTA